MCITETFCYILKANTTLLINYDPIWASLSGKEFTCNAGDTDSIPGVRNIPWKRKWELQYLCLGNLMDGVAWQISVHGVTKSCCNIKKKKFVKHLVLNSEQ